VEAVDVQEAAAVALALGALADTLDDPYVIIGVPASVALAGLTALLYFVKKRHERRN
jgi:hypothetical protein